MTKLLSDHSVFINIFLIEFTHFFNVYKFQVNVVKLRVFVPRTHVWHLIQNPVKWEITSFHQTASKILMFILATVREVSTCTALCIIC